MIKFFRKQLSDTGFRMILWISAGSFMFASLVPLLVRRFGGGGEGLIATVNGLEIPAAEFIKRVQQERNRLDFFRQQFGDQANQFLALFGLTNNPEEAAFNGLQNEKIIESVARDMNLEIAPSYIMSRLQDQNFLAEELGIGGAFIDALGKIDVKKLRTYLKQQGISIADLETMIENQLRRSFVLNFAQAGAYMPEFVLRRQFIERFVPRSYSVLLFSRDHWRTEAQKEAVTDEELTQFFERENKKNKRYLIPEKRSGEAWAFEPLLYGIEVANEEIENKYTKNMKDYLVNPESVTVYTKFFPIADENMRESVRRDADKILKEFKEHPASFPQATRQTFERGGSQDTVARAALNLKADGDISSVITTPEGFMILKRAHHEDPVYKSLLEVRNTIHDALVLDKFKRRFTQDARRAINENKVSTLIEEKQAAKKAVDAVQKTANPLESKLFSLGVDQYAVLFDKGQGYIIRTTAIEKTRVPSLEGVQQQVRTDYYEERADKALKKALDDTRKKVTQEDAAMSDYAHQPGVSLVTTGFVDPQDQKTIKPLEEQGLPTALMMSLVAPASVRSDITEQHGVLIRLDERAEIDNDKYEKEKAALQRPLSVNLERLVQNGFVASLLKNAKIKIYARP